MAFNQFSEDIYVKTFDTDEDTYVGKFQVDTDIDLTHVNVKTVISNLAITTEKMQLYVCSRDSDITSILYASNVISLADITNLNDNWIGWVRFDFDQIPLNHNTEYHYAISIRDYTKVGISYVAGVYDYPVPTYDKGVLPFSDYPIALQIFGYERLLP